MGPAVRASGLTATYPLSRWAAGWGCPHLPASAPGLACWEGCRRCPNQKLRPAYIMVIHRLPRLESQSCGCWPLATQPGRGRPLHPSQKLCAWGEGGHLLLWSLLVEREETFLTRNPPPKLPHLLLARQGHTCPITSPEQGQRTAGLGLMSES